MDPYLFDTNVLIYAMDAASPFHPAARTLVGHATRGTEAACIAEQSLLEFFAVVTQSHGSSKSLSPSDALQAISAWRSIRSIRLLRPRENTFAYALQLADRYRLKNGEIFDAFLVATAIGNGVTRIYSGDKIFSTFTEVEHINPFHDHHQ